jgi:hypothetical protein
MRAVAALAALLAAVSGAELAHAQAGDDAPVALVTEIVGKAETRSGSQTVAVTLLAEFASGARVKLHPGAKMQVLFYGAAEVYALTGPSLVRVSQARLETMSGNEAVKQPGVYGRNGKPLLLRPGAITQAGIVVRGVARPLPALTMTGSATLDPHPVFRWREPEPGLDYRFVLRDGGEAILYERTLRDTSVSLPPDIVLKEAQRYRWSVSAKSPSGTEYAASYRFVYATAQTREDVANFRPEPDAPPAQRVAYALWLEQTGLRDEANRYWQALAAEGVPIPAEKRPQ